MRAAFRDDAERVTHTLDRYKRKRSEDNFILIPILNEGQETAGFLCPVTADFETTIPGCVDLLNRWRAENPTLSPSRFPITHERTQRWITNAIINNDHRILFMVQSLSGAYVGHLGFTAIAPEKRAAEVDQVVRGEKNACPGLMGFAMKSLIRWGKMELGLEHIDLVVLPENRHGIAFYRRCGFERDGIVPLIKVETGEEISWLRCQESVVNPEHYFLHMSLSSKSCSNG